MSTNTSTQVRIKKSLDVKMKEIATKSGKTKAQVYEDAIVTFLKDQSQEQIMQDGKIGQLSKDIALIYGTSIYNLQKTLDVLGLDTKQKYTDSEIMKIMESRGDAIHAHLMIRARENKKQREEAI